MAYTVWDMSPDLIMDYGCFDSPVSSRRDLHPARGVGPVGIMWLMWHVAVGMSGSMKNQRYAATIRRRATAAKP